MIRRSVLPRLADSDTAPRCNLLGFAAGTEDEEKEDLEIEKEDVMDEQDADVEDDTEKG